MKINVNEVLKTLDGSPMKDMDNMGQAIDATLKTALCNVLLSPTKNVKPMEKLERGELARKIFKAVDEVDLTVEEMALCVRLVKEVLTSPLAVLQIVEMLEGKND